MSLELVAGLLGSQLVRTVASEVIANLVTQAVTSAVTTTLTAHGSEPSRPMVVAEDASRLRVVPSIEIVSATAGRARLRVQGLRGDEARADELTARLRALDGVMAVEAKALTGTLLVRFNARRMTLPEIEAVLEPRCPAARSRGNATARPLLRVVGS